MVGDASSGELRFAQVVAGSVANGRSTGGNAPDPLRSTYRHP